MANSYRKSTLKFSFSTEYARPKALEVEQFLREDVKIPSADLIGIHLSIVSSVVYVKLVNDAACDAILEKTKNGLKFRHSDGNIGPVTVDHAGLGLRTIRIFELPFELPADEVVAALRPYGTVHSHVAEKWTQFTTYPVLNGVRQIRIDLGKHVPSYLYIGGCRAIVIYDGQPKTCSGCGKEGHIRSECLQRRIAQLQPTDLLPSTTPTSLPITYVAALRMDPGQMHEAVHSQDLSPVAVLERNEVEQLSSTTVPPPAPSAPEGVEEKSHDRMEMDEMVVPTAAFVPERRDSLQSTDTETHSRKQRSPKRHKKRRKASADEPLTQSSAVEISSHNTEVAQKASAPGCDVSPSKEVANVMLMSAAQPMIVDHHDERCSLSCNVSSQAPRRTGEAFADIATHSTAWADDVVPESSAEETTTTVAAAAHDRSGV